MDDIDSPAAQLDVDVMDVSPAVHSDHPPSNMDDEKENDTTDLEPQPLLTNKKNVQLPATAATTTTLPPTTVSSHLEEENRQTCFTYVLRKYNTIQDNKVHSPYHYFGGFRWRLLIFPKGNQNSNHDLSVYLECGGPRSPESSQSDPNSSYPINGRETSATSFSSIPWSRPAKFYLSLLHATDPIARNAVSGTNINSDANNPDLDISETCTSTAISASSANIVKETSHVFKEHASDWGFLEFAPFTTLQPDHHVDREMNAVIMVRIILQDHLPESMLANQTPLDSRKQIGYVGFKNQGATCYMNSLLQTLYMVSAFRKAVYNMSLPDPNNENAGSELSYALQKVFWELQFSPTVVKTKKLTESFGWDTTDAFTQHDVQELKLILCDELAEKVKKVAPDQPNPLATLFLGKLLNYIECVNVDYESTREEDFTDLSLNVKGCRNIYDSFKKYTEVEMMDGDNKYRADGYEELQDARKGVKFLKLPQVLQLHLKRFEYDCTRFTMVKINDRYEFDTEIDLSKFVENSDGNDIYVLHSVLVHIGDVNGGHYHVFIRPEIPIDENGQEKPSQWLKFDDEAVTRATEEHAVQDNFGVGGEKDHQKRSGIDDDLNNTGLNGGQLPPSVLPTRNRNYQSRRFSNAYMLQYLRKSEVPYLLEGASESDVPESLAARITKEREIEDQRKKERAEQHLYMNVAVATDVNLLHHHSSDFVDWDKVRQLRVKRAMSLGELKSRLQNEGFVSDSRRMRLWKCVTRDVTNTRPESLVAHGVDTQPITDANNIDPLTHTGYEPNPYATRHPYYPHEDVVHMYAEDFTSRYSFGSGQAFTAYANQMLDAKGQSNLNVSKVYADPDLRQRVEMELSAKLGDVALPAFPLLSGKEVLLFIKYYTPLPFPRLQWLGHFVADRSATIRDLHPILKTALYSYCGADLSLENIPRDASISVLEEDSVTEMPSFNNERSMDSSRIPYESSTGDILVFQKTLPSESATNGSPRNVEERYKNGLFKWDFRQDISRADGKDLPLGGRPLPTISSYFEYLTYRVKIQFKDKASIGTPEEGRSIILELLRKDTYKLARTVLAGVLGKDVNPDYIRFFMNEVTREAPLHEAIRIPDHDCLDKILPTPNLMHSGQSDYRTLWYERTLYHLSEFDRKHEVRLTWRPDCGTRSTPYTIARNGNGTHGNNGNDHSGTNTAMSDGVNRSDMEDEDMRKPIATDRDSNGNIIVSSKYGKPGPDGTKAFSVLVPINSRYSDVIDQVKSKLNINSEIQIRLLEISESRVSRIIHPNDLIPALLAPPHDIGTELRAEPIPDDETEEALSFDYKLITVVHLEKLAPPRPWRGYTRFFGVPFMIKVRKDGETIRSIRQRIQKKLDVPSEEFETWRLAEFSQVKVVFLEDLNAKYTPQTNIADELCSLAIEHKSTAPSKRVISAMSRYVDKPLKIRS